MQDFINLLWQCFYDVTEVDVSFDDVENIVDEGLEDDFNLVYEDR